MKKKKGPSALEKMSSAVTRASGSSSAFIIAVLVIIAWLVSGPLFHFSDTWQLVINTATTIVTFLMVFLIQNTQNRDAKAVHLKLDELITRRYPLEDVNQGYQDMLDGKNIRGVIIHEH